MNLSVFWSLKPLPVLFQVQAAWAAAKLRRQEPALRARCSAGELASLSAAQTRALAWAAGTLDWADVAEALAADPHSDASAMAQVHGFFIAWSPPNDKQ